MKTRPTNILQFRAAPDDDLLTNLDEETWRRINEVAVLDGITADDVIRAALHCFLSEFKIGDLLLVYLQRLSKVAKPRSAKARVIEHWKERIQKILDDLGKNKKGDPPENAA